jgi:hypothetical protein
VTLHNSIPSSNFSLAVIPLGIVFRFAIMTDHSSNGIATHVNGDAAPSIATLSRSELSTLARTAPDPETRRSAATALSRGIKRRKFKEDLRTVLTMDHRTKAARGLRVLERRLLAEIGPNPSMAARALVSQALQLKIRLLEFDRSFTTGGALSVHDSRVYLAWSNSYVRTLKALGLKSDGGAEPLDPFAAIEAGRRQVHAEKAARATAFDPGIDPLTDDGDAI